MRKNNGSHRSEVVWKSTRNSTFICSAVGGLIPRCDDKKVSEEHALIDSYFKSRFSVNEKGMKETMKNTLIVQATNSAETQLGSLPVFKYSQLYCRRGGCRRRWKFDSLTAMLEIVLCLQQSLKKRDLWWIFSRSHIYDTFFVNCNDGSFSQLQKFERKNFWILKILIYYESNNEIAAATKMTSHMSHNEILKSLAGVVNSLIEGKDSMIQNLEKRFRGSWRLVWAWFGFDLLRKNRLRNGSVSLPLRLS